jgi:elongation factor P hydroxylase
VPAPTGAGAAYLFSRAESVWSHAHYITASNREAEDHFGHGVAIDGQSAVIVAPFEDSSAVGVDGNQADNSFLSAGAAYAYSLAPCLILGDMNCDCVVDIDDVDAFVLALLDATAYDTAYPSCEILNADILTDGNVDSGDAQGFVDLLVP